MKPTILAALGAFALLALTAPAASASSLQSADFKPGHTIAVGISGLSYDYAFQAVSLGLGVQASPQQRPMPMVRGLVRFFEADGTSAALIAGVAAMPASYGTRQSLAPDVGISLAHRFGFGQGEMTVGGQPIADLKFTVRVNMTLTAAPRDAYYIPADDPDPAPLGNLFQRLNMGPQSTIALSFDQSEHLEFTLGGGTLLGMRVKF